MVDHQHSLDTEHSVGGGLNSYRFKFRRVLCRWWVLGFLTLVGWVLFFGWGKARETRYQAEALVEIKLMNLPFDAGVDPMKLQQELSEKGVLERLNNDESVAMEVIKEATSGEWQGEIIRYRVNFLDEDKGLSMLVCQSICDAIVKQRAEIEMNLREQLVSQAKIDLQNAQDSVQEIRVRLKYLGEMARGYDLLLDLPPGTKLDAEKLNSLRLVDLGQERKSLIALQKKFEKIDPEELEKFAEDWDDRSLRKALNNRKQMKVELQKLKNARLSDDHRDVMSLIEKINSLNTVIDKYTDNIRALISHKIKVLDQRVQKAKDRWESEEWPDDKAKTLIAINEVRKKLQEARKRVGLCELKLEKVRTKLSLPQSTVIFHVPPHVRAVDHKKGLGVSGMLFQWCSAFLVAIVLMYGAEVLMPRQRNMA